MHSAFYKNGKLTLKRKKIFKNYMKNDCFFDLLGIIGFQKNFFFLNQIRLIYFYLPNTECIRSFIIFFICFANKEFFFEIKTPSAVL